MPVARTASLLHTRLKNVWNTAAAASLSSARLQHLEEACKRGGGCLCYSNSDVHSAFASIVGEVADPCGGRRC